MQLDAMIKEREKKLKEENNLANWVKKEKVNDEEAEEVKEYISQKVKD